jgi:hypothetical protein
MIEVRGYYTQPRYDEGFLDGLVNAPENSYRFVAVKCDNFLMATPRLPVDLKIMATRIPLLEFKLRQL